MNANLTRRPLNLLLTFVLFSVLGLPALSQIKSLEYDTFLCSDENTLATFWKLYSATDSEGLQSMIDKKEIIHLPQGTHVLIQRQVNGFFYGIALGEHYPQSPGYVPTFTRETINPNLTVTHIATVVSDKALTTNHAQGLTLIPRFLREGDRSWAQQVTTLLNGHYLKEGQRIALNRVDPPYARGVLLDGEYKGADGWYFLKDLKRASVRFVRLTPKEAALSPTNHLLPLPSTPAGPSLQETTDWIVGYASNVCFLTKLEDTSGQIDSWSVSSNQNLAALASFQQNLSVQDGRWSLTLTNRRLDRHTGSDLEVVSTATFELKDFSPQNIRISEYPVFFEDADRGRYRVAGDTPLYSLQLGTAFQKPAVKVTGTSKRSGEQAAPGKFQEATVEILFKDRFTAEQVAQAFAHAIILSGGQ